MKEKTLKIEDIYDINDALDLYSRILCGQYDKLLSFYHIGEGCSKENKKIKELFISLRQICIPQLNSNNLYCSLGIWSPETPKEAVKAYDIQQILRYQLAYHHNPQGGITVNFNSPFIHGKYGMANKDKDIVYNTIQSFQYPDYFPKGFCGKIWECPLVIISFDEDEETATLMRNPYYIDVIINKACCFYKAIENKDLERAFLPLYPYMEEKDKKRMTYYIELIMNYVENGEKK